MVLVAIHAASGTEGVFFPHTHYGIFSEVRLNGRPVCEADIYCAYLGESGVPVGFVSGEDIDDLIRQGQWSAGTQIT